MEHILSLSYGKDSLACLGAIKELDLPLDRIIHAEIWATDTIPADLPPMVEFKKKADRIIRERYGIEVEHVSAGVTYEDIFYRKRKTGKRIGKIYGFPCMKGAWCNSKLKVTALNKINKNAVMYIGIAYDEPERFKTLVKRKISPLVMAKWTESDCRKWCEENDLLSSIYRTSSRGGCWFCHNQSVDQLRLLRKNHPEYWNLLLKWDMDSPITFKLDFHTVHDYEKRFELEDKGCIQPDDRRFKWSCLDEKAYISPEFKAKRSSVKVLSLFDGISCGMVALERAGIPVEKYDAFEIDKYAISVSSNNFPNIVHHGNVFDGDFTQFKGYDLLLGGSPCTYWSIAKKGRETTSDGEGFRLFMQFVRALHESKCRYFLYENNYSIHENIKAEITEKLGVKPIMINSALVSAQSRKRCYWTNIPNIVQPEDKGVLLKDVLEKSAVPVNGTADKKARTIRAQYSKTGLANAVRQDGLGATMAAEPVILQKGYGFNKGGIKREKCPTITANGDFAHNNFVAEPVRIGQYGNGGLGERIYSVYGKSVSMKANGGGGGAKTGLYKIDLPDGDYIIRKLTPVEAEHLQTLPDNYTEGVSDTQRYKCLGNGWTVDVIAHILGFIPEGNIKNEN